MLTHLHKDHIGGAPELFRECSIGTIYHGGERVPGVVPHILDSLVNAHHIPIIRVRAGDVIHIDSAVQIFVVHPDSLAVAPGGETLGGNLNNGSVVLKIQYGETSILLSGDLEREREVATVARYGNFFALGYT